MFAALAIMPKLFSTSTLQQTELPGTLYSVQITPHFLSNTDSAQDHSSLADRCNHLLREDIHDYVVAAKYADLFLLVLTVTVSCQRTL